MYIIKGNIINVPVPFLIKKNTVKVTGYLVTQGSAKMANIPTRGLKYTLLTKFNRHFFAEKIDRISF